MGLGAGQIATDADFTLIDNTTDNKPIGRALANAVQSIADNTVTALALAAEDFDTGGFHSTSVNNTRVTPLVAGYYRFYGTYFAGAMTTPVTAYAALRKNGSTIVPPADRIIGLGSAFSLHTTILIEMNGSTDYVEVVGLQDSAGAVNSTASGQYTSVLEWEYVRSL